MGRYRVTLDFPDNQVARGIAVDAIDTEHAERAAVENWESRMYEEAPGPLAFYRITKVEKKERRRFGRVRWVVEAAH